MRRSQRSRVATTVLTLLSRPPLNQPLIEWVRRAHASRRRICGICFGHQIVAEALGGRGTVMPNPSGFEAGRLSFELTPKASSYFQETLGVRFSAASLVFSA